MNRITLGRHTLSLLVGILALVAIAFSGTRSSEPSIATPGIATEDIDLRNVASIAEDKYDYAGLSSYLGDTIPFLVSEDGKVRRIKAGDDPVTISGAPWVGFRGRFETVIVDVSGRDVEVTANGLDIEDTRPNERPRILRFTHGRPGAVEGELGDAVTHLQYLHLPGWLAWLCRIVEWLYTSLQNVSLGSWTLALVLLAILIRILLAPIHTLTARWQSEVSTHRAALEPEHRRIKENLKGEDAHKALMESYKSRGISPYYTLKPLLATILGLPILIAIFNMLGEVEPLRHQGFLWADSLAYPDSLFKLPNSIPFFGDHFNVFPFLMFGVTVLSAHLVVPKETPLTEVRRQRRGLVFMGLFFLVLFYPFPSGMVIYWTLVTLLTLLAGRFVQSHSD